MLGEQHAFVGGSRDKYPEICDICDGFYTSDEHLVHEALRDALAFLDSPHSMSKVEVKDSIQRALALFKTPTK